MFIQFNRDASGKLEPLPAQHVDTGLGFERVCAVLQGKTDNYATDIFSPLMDSLAETTGVRYGQGDETDVALRVIADHARACTFAIADGVLPSNEGRGYVIRRILRRAARFGRNLNQHEPFIHNLAAVTAEQVGGFFPEVAQRTKQVAETILEEEVAFNRTLDDGIKTWWSFAGDALDRRFKEEHYDKSKPDEDRLWIHMSELAPHSELDFYERKGLPVFRPETNLVISRGLELDSGNERFRNPLHESKLGDISAEVVQRFCKTPPHISGEAAFKLYATYGFPIDLTQLMARERGMTVDIVGFEAEMAAHRELSRVRSTLLTSEYQQRGGKTEFHGYENEELETHVIDTLKIVRDETGSPSILSKALSEGDEGIVFLRKSPFYAEAGGQVGDTGTIEQDSGTFRVTDTRKEVPAPGTENYCHRGVVEKGKIQARTHSVRRSKPPGSGKELPPHGISGKATARVDKERRQDIARNHTATHLLNWALRKVLGGQIDQAGSVVAPDRLRFDFTYGKAVTPEQLAEVERLVNEVVLADEQVVVPKPDVPLARARELPGVRAVFGEKYPDPVRIVAIGTDKPVEHPEEARTIEFCGGTHLSRTSQAGFFKILSEESVARGVRRITAVTGGEAVRHVQMLDEAVSTASAALRVPAEQISERIAAMQKEIKRLRKSAGGGAARGGEEFRPEFVIETPEGDALIGSVDFADAGAMRKICDVQRQKGAAAVLIGGAADGKITLVAMVSDALVKSAAIKAGDWVKVAAAVVGGTGGGKPTMAQAGGKDAEKLPEALKAGRDWIQERLG